MSALHQQTLAGHRLTKKEKKLEMQQHNLHWGIKRSDQDSDPSPRFSSYYKAQFPMLQSTGPDSEWQKFRNVLSQKLPTTLRFSADRFPVCSAVLKRRLLTEFSTPPRGKYVEVNGKPLTTLVTPLHWTPNAVQLSTVDAASLNQTPELKGIASLLQRESALGHLCKQELVSMLPALLLTLPSCSSDTGTSVVQSHHKLLDMCASPGSKTDQLVSLLHECYNREKRQGTLDHVHQSSSLLDLPRGMVVANDADTSRIQTIRNRYAHFPSPNLICTCARGEELHSRGIPSAFFDHILTDVPCSGDGTIRKSPHMWRNFRPRVGMEIHSIQLQIALAAVELLSMAPGSRLVYSTCSLNPMEDESVVCSILREHGHSLRLVDLKGSIQKYCSAGSEYGNREDLEKIRLLGQFRWEEGLSHWRADTDVMVGGEGAAEEELTDNEDEGNGDGDDRAAAADGADKKRKNNSTSTAASAAAAAAKRRKLDAERERSIKKLPRFTASMRPPKTEEERERFHLERCMRVFPHHQDTGGFFIAVLERYDEGAEAAAAEVPRGQAGQQSKGGRKAAASSGDGSTIANTANSGNKAKLNSASSVLSRQRELMVMRDLCGFNPKQIYGLQAESEEDSGAVSGVQQWRKDCNVFSYSPLSADAYRSIERAFLGGLGKGPAQANISHQVLNQLWLVAHPFEATPLPPAHLLAAPATAPATATAHIAAAEAEAAATAVESAPQGAWKGLKLAAKWAPVPAPTGSATAAPVQAPVTPKELAFSGFVTLASESVSQAITAWGALTGGKCKGLIVQAGAEILQCHHEKNAEQGADPSKAASLRVALVEHSRNSALYASHAFANVIQGVTVDVAAADDMIAVLQECCRSSVTAAGSAPGAASAKGGAATSTPVGAELNCASLPPAVHQDLLRVATVAAGAAVECLVRLKVECTEGAGAEASNSGAGGVPPSSSSSSSGSGSGSAVAAGKVYLSKAEKKRLKKTKAQQGSEEGHMQGAVTAQSSSSSSSSSASTGGSGAESVVVQPAAEWVCVVVTVQRGSGGVQVATRTPQDMCQSLLEVVSAARRWGWTR